jgi:2'-5' RNA ligase
VKRLFIAVDLDAATRAAVSTIIATLRLSVASGVPVPTVIETGRTRITWVPPDRLHLTLEFLGDADAGLERRAVSVFGQPIPMAPFDLGFDGIGFFPSAGSPASYGWASRRVWRNSANC